MLNVSSSHFQTACFCRRSRFRIAFGVAAFEQMISRPDSGADELRMCVQWRHGLSNVLIC